MIKWLLTCLIACITLNAKPEQPTVCLNMIVKNESRVITRCLNSVKHLLDYWVIVDTGSNDGTQEIIKDYMKDVPGELIERPWVNFGHNRNEALQLAKGKGDYVFFIDADEVLEGTFDKKLLELEAYLVTIRISSEPLITFQRALMINNHLDWNWKGVLHETLKMRKNGEITDPVCGIFQGVVITAEAKDGNRAQDPQKWMKDAMTLEKALIDEPDNSDYVYYLAQSYYNANEIGLALKNYKKRALMDGWDQHTFWSKYFAGTLQETLNMDAEVIIKSYCDAFHYRPTRLEPIFRLAQYFYNQKDLILAFILSEFGATIPVPNDIVYVEEWMYSYGIHAILANSSLELGKIDQAAISFNKIAQEPQTPKWIRDQALSAYIRIMEQTNPVANK